MRSGRTAGVSALALLAGASAASAATYSYYTLDNPADPNFNQLLGINKSSIIVGYDGDGSVKPNKGYVLVPQIHYSAENVPGSAQTQAVGINNDVIPSVVGFWVDAKGNNYGFLNVQTFLTIAYPNTPASGGVRTNQLLGVNDKPVAVGFYNDAAGNSHGYAYSPATKAYTLIKLPFKGVVSYQATGINNSNLVCGFYQDKTKTHGFYGTLGGTYVSVDVPGYASAQFFGCNNTGYLAGAVTTAAGVSEGLVYDAAKKTTQIIKDPEQSTKAAFGVSGTLINGINDDNEVVGFYSDGTKVHGFWGRPS